MKKIKDLPVKSRTVRKPENCKVNVDSKTSIIYITRGLKSQFYKVEGNGSPEPIEFVPAAEILRADQKELAGDFEKVKDIHYQHVDRAFKTYQFQEDANNDTTSLSVRKNDNGTKAMAVLRRLKRAFRNDEVYEKIVVLEEYVTLGVFNRLTKEMNSLGQKINKMTNDGTPITSHANQILPIIENYYDKYYISLQRRQKDDEVADALIITSETFE